MFESPSADPERALALAVRSLRLLAIVCILLGLILVLVGGVFNPLTQFRRSFLAVGGVLFLGPGIIYAAFLPALGRRRFVAFVACISIAACQTLVAAASFAVQFIYGPMTPIPVLLSILWVAAMVQLLVHLSRGFGAVRLAAHQQQRGFEPLPPRPVLPVDPTTIDVSNHPPKE